MTISVNPMTSVIYVPKADLTLVSGVRYRLNVGDDFRMWLKAWEDDENSAPMLKTHTHNTEVTVGGTPLPRVVIVLFPYTVEFEDGQYEVLCTDANHNIMDVKVPNQVSLIIGNSAGLSGLSAFDEKLRRIMWRSSPQ